MTLLNVLFRCLRKPFLIAILPRIFLTFFRYSQPVLISQAIEYVTSDELSRPVLSGHRLVIVAAVVYLGLAVSQNISIGGPSQLANLRPDLYHGLSAFPEQVEDNDTSRTRGIDS